MSWIVAALSGALLWTGFAPLEFWVGPFLGSATLFWVLCHRRSTKRILLAFVGGLSFFLPLLHWSSVYVGSIPWLILAFGQSAIFALIGGLNWQRQWKSAFSFAALFTLIELLRMKFPFGGFGWGRLGFTQVDSLNLVYPLVGVTGISLIVTFVGAALWFSRRAILIILIAILVNWAVVSQVEDPSRDKFQVTAVQGGVDNLGLDFNERALRVLERHIQATRVVSGTQLYIWPENASDVDPIQNRIAQRMISGLIRRLDAPLLVGGVENQSGGPTNSSLLFNEKGELASRYVKQDLAPFGEYVPLRSLAESVSPYAARINDFVPGSNWVKHRVANAPFQSLICFEVLDDDHVKLGAKGASFLVAQTNNATFGTSSEAAQQLQITRARAAETKREIAVVSTTGFTAHLASNGKILANAPQFAAAELTMTISLIEPATQTPAQRAHSWAWALILMLSLLGARISDRR